MLEQLKNLNVDRPEMDELLALHACGNGLQASYDSFKVEKPEWLDNSMRALTREIENRKQAVVEKRVREIRSSLAGLETTTEKRERLKSELAALEGGTVNSVAQQ